MADAGRVIIHASTIGFIKFQLVCLFTIPMPKTAPIRICVELTGSPNMDAVITTLAADSSALNPEAGCILVKLVPTVAITSLPINQSPATKAIANVTITMEGTGAWAFIRSVEIVSIIAAKGPTAFAISLDP